MLEETPTPPMPDELAFAYPRPWEVDCAGEGQATLFASDSTRIADLRGPLAFGLARFIAGCANGTARDQTIADQDYARIFTIARGIGHSHGYAVMIHGSATRDLDLMAFPWRENPSTPEHLVAHLLSSLDMLQANATDPAEKPNGRLVWTLTMKTFGDPRFVDLSVVKPV